MRAIDPWDLLRIHAPVLTSGSEQGDEARRKRIDRAAIKAAGEIGDRVGRPPDPARVRRMFRAFAAFCDGLERTGALALYGHAVVKSLFRPIFGADVRGSLYGPDREPCRMLLLGETGTGKEGLAQTAMGALDRLAATQVQQASVNCAAFSEHILDSELFGHVAGAYTGAIGERQGVLGSVADGGILFADEFGEMPESMQVRLLRVVQTGEFRRVGADKPEKNRARFHLIAATASEDRNSDRRRAGLREDLFHRISSVVRVPPLRELLRRKDARPPRKIFEWIAHRVVRDASGGSFDRGPGEDPMNPYHRWRDEQVTSISGELEARLSHYRWPGNLRECANVVTRICNEGIDRAAEICDELSRQQPVVEADHNPRKLPTNLPERVRDLRRQYLSLAIEQHRTLDAVAQSLSLNRETARRWIKDLNLSRDR